MVLLYYGLSSVRSLDVSDYNKNYYDLLNNLTHIKEDVSFDTFQQFVTSLSDSHNVFVIEDLTTQKIVGSITTYLQPTPIHNCHTIVHMDHWVADPTYKGIGGMLLTHVIDLAKKNGYKLSTTCPDKMIGYYEKKEFRKRGNHMCLYF
jgi:predicted GNAT family acetyltransferase